MFVSGGDEHLRSLRQARHLQKWQFCDTIAGRWPARAGLQCFMTVHESKEGTGAGSFGALGLAPKLLEMLHARGISVPTPIQARAIPVAVGGGDVIGVAQTGTGKTLAFGLPLAQRLAAAGGSALILVPTRELALQVQESLAHFTRTLGLSSCVLIGGAPMGRQISDLRRNPRIIIATPGRLLDHMQERTVRLTHISILVIDEADRMLDMGFWPQIRSIITTVPQERQTMLFSATLSDEIMTLATKHMRTPTSVEVAPPGTTADKVSQEFFIVRKEEKLRLLERILGERTGSAIVFTRTKHGAKRITRVVRAMGHTAAELHANRTLSQRREAMNGFKVGAYRVLVATDIAARGIDVQDVALVVNYDMPMQSSDYVHRIGRTARAGKAGHAISFAMPDERRALRDIERLIRVPIRVSAVPDLPPPRAIAPEEERGARPMRPMHRGRSSHAPRPFSRGGRPQSGGFRRGPSSAPSRGNFRRRAR